MIKRLMKTVLFLIIVGLIAACGSAPSESTDTSGDTDSGGDSTTVSVAYIDLQVANSQVSLSGTADITVELLSSSGQRILDPKVVSFSISAPTIGSMDPSAVILNGSGTTNFLANNSSGSVTITASVDGVTGSLILQVGDVVTEDPDVSVSAVAMTASSTQIGTGETATISTELLNASGQLISGTKTVYYTLSNPALGSIESPVVITDGSGSTTFTAKTTESTVTITATVDSVTTTMDIQISDAVQAATVNVTATPTSVSLTGTSAIRATVLDTNGNNMPDGTTVSFLSSNTSVGSVTTTATTVSGIATATFVASVDTAGTATVTASTGSVTGSVDVIVIGADASSIQFNSATPQVIGLKGSGQTEVSSVKFLVSDINGNPVIGDVQVDIELSGPNGGEYIGDSEGTTEISVSTVNGYASVNLHSGTIPGTVTLTATINGTNLSTSSGVISIGGGVPSAGHFSLSSEKLNLEGLSYNNIQTNVNTLLADRYGNYNVLEGTTVSYYAECGAIDRTVALDNTGSGSVVFRTQVPTPIDTTPGECPGNSTCDIESNYITSFNTIFGVNIADGRTNTPRDGVCTITVVVDGEEEFTDNNADGLFNTVVESPVCNNGTDEPFDDTYDDIFIDMNDDSVIDNAFEDLVVDRNLDGNFDGNNCRWDSNKRIYKEHHLLITGVPTITLTASSFAVADGGSQTIYFSIHDLNYNPPISGTSFSVTADGGKLGGNKNGEFLDTASPGSPIYAITIFDDDIGDIDPAELVTITFSWDYKGATYNYAIGGTVD